MSNEEAEIRRARLLELRDGAEPVLSEPEAESRAPEGRGRLRKLLAERRRGAGEGVSMDAGRPMRAGGRRGGESAPGAALERFPRLAQLLAERQEETTGGGAVTAANSPEEIASYREGLESLVDWLEQTLDSTREQLAEVRRWGIDRGSVRPTGGSEDGSGANG
jgi:hypothetical protein